MRKHCSLKLLAVEHEVKKQSSVRQGMAVLVAGALLGVVVCLHRVDLEDVPFSCSRGSQSRGYEEHLAVSPNINMETAERRASRRYIVQRVYGCRRTCPRRARWLRG